jgi:hypothetical protein
MTTTSGPRSNTHPHAILLGQYFIAGAFGNADELALLPTQFLIAGAYGNADPHAARQLARFFIAGAFRTADQRAVWPAPYLIAGAYGTTDPLAPQPAQLLVAGAFGNADPLTRQPASICFAGALAPFVVKLAIECWDHGSWTLAVLAEVPPLAILAKFEHVVATRSWRARWNAGARAVTRATTCARGAPSFRRVNAVAVLTAIRHVALSRIACDAHARVYVERTALLIDVARQSLLYTGCCHVGDSPV